MAETEAPRTGKVLVIVMIVLLVALAAATTYAVMSDNSVRGLTVRIFNPTRTCPTDPLTDTNIVTFSLSALVYSTHSLRTSISQVRFQLSVDGVGLGTFNATDRAFEPGHGTSYILVFKSPALDPSSLPATSRLVLAIAAQVSAGIYGMKVTASDSETISWGTGC